MDQVTVYTYEFNKSLVPIGSDITLSVDNLPKWLPQFDQFLFSTFPWQVPQMENFGWRLGVPELWLAGNRRHSAPRDPRPKLQSYK